MMRTARPSGSSAVPLCCSTVTPGKFATFWRSPVRRLKSVVLPEFGGPTSATAVRVPAKRVGSATAVPPQFAQPWHSLTSSSIGPAAPDLQEHGGLAPQRNLRAIHLKHPWIAAGSALASRDTRTGQKSQFHEPPRIVGRQVEPVHYAHLAAAQIHQRKHGAV